MKKLFFTLFIAFSSLLSVNAQEIGQFWLGGSFGFWSDKIAGGESVTSFQFLPELGYAINEDIGLGIRLGYRSQETLEYDYDDYYGGYDISKERVNTLTIAPFVRWAFLKGHFGGLFLDGGIGYSYGTIDDYDDYSLQQIEVGISPGVAINVSQSVSLIGKFGFAGYRHIKEGVDDYNTYLNSFGLNLDMSEFLVGAVIKF